MTAGRRVRERDVRLPEFRDSKLADLEFRADGTVARKDRWERGIREIAGIVGLNPRETFEVGDVVAAVKAIALQLRSVSDPSQMPRPTGHSE